jgi:hypothetical protein
MAEELLDHPEVGAVLEEVAGKGVAEHMRRDPGRGYPGGRRKSLEVAGKGLARQVAGVAEGREEPRAVARAGRFSRREIGGRSFPRLVR